MIQHVIVNDSLQGPVNLVSPNAISNREFTRLLGHALHRPALFPMPAFAARIAFGEMADDLLLASTRVVPKKLMASRYTFRHPHLEELLKHILSQSHHESVL